MAGEMSEPIFSLTGQIHKCQRWPQFASIELVYVSS